MTVTLTPHAQELVERQIANAGGSPEQVLEQALEQFVRQDASNPQHRTIAEAIRNIRSSRKGIVLGGLTIRDLINEGRRY